MAVRGFERELTIFVSEQILELIMYIQAFPNFTEENWDVNVQIRFPEEYIKYRVFTLINSFTEWNLATLKFIQRTPYM